MDILPTLASLAGAVIPTTFPGRELTPLAGVSLTPVFDGKELGDRPPIHFLFESDRALRDGDWKLGSFRGGPWELYNIREDRAETTDRAAAHPERVAAMAAEWQRRAEKEVLAKPKELQPVAKEPRGPHPEWTDFTGRGRTKQGNR